MQLIVLFLEGVITFVSPCLLPMIPVYVSFFAAGKSDKRRAIINSLGFVTGFTIVFVTMGALAGVFGRVFQMYGTYINIVAGAIVIVLGLNFLGIIKIGLLNRTTQRTVNTKNLKFLSSIIFGVVFSVGWTPCVGAFLGSALIIASQNGGAVEGIIMLLIYSAGLGIPFVLSAVLIDNLKGTFGFIKRNYKIINAVSGGFLIVVGILIATGLMGKLLSMLTF